MNWKRIAAVAAVVGAGYVLAVAVASVVTVAVMFGHAALFSGPPPEPLAVLMPEIAGYMLAGMTITFPTALPGFLVVVWMSLSRNWDRWWRFALAGAADAIVALSVFNLFFGATSGMPLALIPPTLPGGFLGGLAYWLAAGRFVPRLQGSR